MTLAIRHVRITPIAFRDPPLLNAAGIHEPWALRSIIEIETACGRVGINETYGDLPMLDALAKAAEDARAKAKVLADALGVKLGAVHTLNANAEYVPPPMAQKARFTVMAAADAAPESGNAAFGFSAGQIRYSASVNADFDLVAP